MGVHFGSPHLYGKVGRIKDTGYLPVLRVILGLDYSNQ